jgi:hypothetical protein
MRRFLTLFTALLLALTVTSPAQAKTVRVPFEAQEVTIAVPDPGRSWVSGGIEHTRGLTLVYAATSDNAYYRGETTVVVNMNVSLATGRGTMWGTSDLELSDYEGGFAGTWVATFYPDGSGWIAQGRTRGYGEVAGLQQRFSVDNTGFVTGFVMIPGGSS